MSKAKIARVYADALFRAAEEEGRVQSVRDDLHAFAQAVREHQDLRDALSDREIPSEVKKRLVLKLTEGADPLVRNVLRLLIDKNRESIVDELDVAFGELFERLSEVVKVSLTTARPLPEAVVGEIKDLLERSLKKKVELELHVDESIIGGAKLRIGDRIADGSVRNRLEQLRARLISPTARLEGSVEAAS